MTANELRRKYISFFESKGHAVLRSAPLIPENDPTVLFTTAGMHPLVPYLLGEPHPLGKRLVDCQKCVRTGDIDEVGDAVHLTFFEMLGNWSLGDYFKSEAIAFSHEFLCSSEWLGLDMERLSVSVFAGDDDAPFDEEAFEAWRSHGVPESRIGKLGKRHNWWGPAGKTGPCGPDTEMFYWTGEGAVPESFDPDDSRWVEIWNDVFMQYNKTGEGAFEPLEQRNVDTGMGLERVTAILQGEESCYDTELFQPIFEALDRARGVVSDGARSASERVIADHLRASVFIMADGVAPGNVDQPYVLRRLLRHAMLKGMNMGVSGAFLVPIARSVVETYSEAYPELSSSADAIYEEVEREEAQFAKTLEKGVREFEKSVASIPEHVKNKVISGRSAFKLFDTYGLPLELTVDLACERGFSVDVDGFEKAYRKHQEKSREGAAGKFQGGLADDSEKTSALHTATHLLHEALRRVLGPHVAQRGSNITAERLRFDFSHPAKMTPEEVSSVESIVNEEIAKGREVVCEEMSKDEALSSGAIGLFVDKYGDRVKVYSIGDFSKEICGGPHAESVAGLGRFRIKKEESVSRGVRRVKAVLE